MQNIEHHIPSCCRQETREVAETHLDEVMETAPTEAGYVYKVNDAINKLHGIIFVIYKLSIYIYS